MRVTYVVALAAVLTIPSAQAGVAEVDLKFLGGVNGRMAEVEVGSVIAHGSLVDGSCRFPGRTSIGAAGARRTVHISTVVTDTCAMVVSGKGFVEDSDGVGAGVISVVPDTEGAGILAGALLEPRTKVPRKGETEFSILEQFDITAYELHLTLNALQDTASGEISGANWESSYCYVSAFPGNKNEECYGDFPSRGGDYAEARLWGRFDNTTVGGPEMILHTVHIITRLSSGGLCELVEGDYPPSWEGDCKITRVR